MSSAVALTLDTSAYSHLRFGHAEVIEVLSRAVVIHVPMIVVGELEAAFRRGARYKENRKSLDEFLEEPFVITVPVGIEIAQQYGLVLARLRKRGKPIPTNDIWIAATALYTRTHLLTFDNDFGVVEGLEHTILRGE
jgi:predicted nucleic acid-binding protein